MIRPSPRHTTALLRPARAVALRGSALQFFPPVTIHSAQISTTAPASSSTSTSPSSSPSSVNEAEISHFSALASSWWDPHGPSRPLHLMNPLRHDFIRACLSSSSSTTTTTTTAPPRPSSSKLRYLDVGCGGGIFAESAARLPTTASVTAIDPSPAILAVARAHARRDPSLLLPAASAASSCPGQTSGNVGGGGGGGGKLRYLSETIESLPLPAGEGDRYDVVTVFEVVEHVDYPAQFLDRVGEFVKPGGWLVLSTIARTWASWVVTKLVAEDLLRVVPRGTHDWDKYINPDELEAYFNGKAGRWGPARVMGVVYVPGMGWREVQGSEKVGNYFLGVQRIG